jgi:hypothetical protein
MKMAPEPDARTVDVAGQHQQGRRPHHVHPSRVVAATRARRDDLHAPCSFSSEKIGKWPPNIRFKRIVRWHRLFHCAWRGAPTQVTPSRAEPVMSLCYSCPSLSSSPDRQSAGILRGFKRPSTPEDRAAGSPAGGCRDPVLGRRAPSAQSRFGSATRKTTGALVPHAASGSSIVADSQV